MVTVVLDTSSGETRRRSYTLPSCAPGILAQLERISSTVEQAQRDGQTSLRLTFHVRGDKSTRVELTALE